MPDDADRPLVGLPIAAGSPGPGGPPARHETVLPEEPAEALSELATARAAADPEAIAAVCGRHPAFLEGWARLAEARLAGGDPVAAYACARVAYHRGLDRLRKHGWGGTGTVTWRRPTNRGFLRGLHALLAAAAALDETDEAVRCRDFLLELDPEDTLGVAAYPQVPGAGFRPPALPDS